VTDSGLGASPPAPGRIVHLGSDDPTVPTPLITKPAAGVPARTTLPPPRDPNIPPPRRRQVGALTRNDLLNAAGAAAVALCLTFLLFGKVAAFSGLIGFVVLAYIVFLVTYALLASLSDDGPAVRDKIMTAVLYTVTSVALLALGWVVVATVWKGHRPLGHLNFFTQDLSTTGYRSPRSVGGIKHALVGTLWQIGLALLITAPLGLSCAVFLSEVGGRFARIVRTVAEAMTALPSIVAGLFIYISWIVTFHFQHSGFAAALALSVTMLPIIIRAADVVLRLVPGNLREASSALGAPDWRTVWHVVLPTARSGLTTAVILGTAWGIGETAPVLLTAGYTTYLNSNPTSGPMVSLPLVAYELVRTGIGPFIERGFAAAAFLLLVVVALFVIARIIGGRGPGQLTRGQARRRRRASRRDLARFEARAATAEQFEGMTT
jgi:phosphate transport system permease protein